MRFQNKNFQGTKTCIFFIILDQIFCCQNQTADLLVQFQV